MKKIDLLLNTNSLYEPLTGIGRYTYNLSKCLLKKSVANKSFKVRFHKIILTYKAIPLQKAKIFRSKYFKPLLSIFIYLIRKFKIDFYLMSSSFASAPIFVKLKTIKSIYHGTNFYLPRLPSYYKKIVTIHDLSVFKYPHYHPIQRVHEVSRNILNSIKNADLIVTDSKYTKNEISDYFDIDKSKIKFIHLAADEKFKYLPASKCINKLQIYNSNFNIKLSYKSFFLHIGTFEPRKNLIRLIKAFLRLDKKLQQKYPLVLIGATSWLESEINDLIEKNKNIIKLDYVTDNDLVIFYNSARAFFFPSLYEGFGLPIVESMSCKTATFCSDISSMPEIQNNYMYRFNPKSISQINNLMIKSFDDKFIEKCENICFERAKFFSWDKVTNEYMEIYNNL